MLMMFAEHTPDEYGDYMRICFDYERGNTAQCLLLTVTTSSWVTLLAHTQSANYIYYSERRMWRRFTSLCCLL